MRALLEAPRTMPELTCVSGLAPSTITDYLRALRKLGILHVSGWDTDGLGRESLRVYSLGPGLDKPRSKKSKAQVARECRQRKREQILKTRVPHYSGEYSTGTKVRTPP
jgi:DNA-binding transcriptional ArsR family regulator